MTATAPQRTNAREQLIYFTDGRWEVDDLATLLDYSAAMYTVIVAHTAIRQVLAHSPIVQPRARVDAAEALLDVLTERVDATIQFNDEWALRAALFGEVRYATLAAALKRDIPSLTPTNTLRIGPIHMASPGSITLLGLGDAMREFREFVKDLWYRNSQEERRNDMQLEAAQLYLDSIRGRRSLPPGFVPRDVLILAVGLLRIDALAETKKIVAAGTEEDAPPSHRPHQ